MRVALEGPMATDEEPNPAEAQVWALLAIASALADVSVALNNIAFRPFGPQ